jgi:integrase/recombinase XerD
MELEDLHKSFIRERLYLDNVSPKTIDFYNHSFSAYKRNAPTLTEVSTPILNEFVVNLRASGVKPTTCNTYIRGVNSFLSWMFKSEFIPARLAIKQLRVERTIPPVLTPADLTRLLRYSPACRSQRRVHTIVMVILDAGLRVNEAVTMRLSDVDMDRMTLRVMGKGRKERIVPFSHELRRILFRWDRNTGTNSGALLFPNRDGGLLTYRNLLRDYALMLTSVGVNRSAVGGFHRLRHTYATAFCQTGNAFHLMRILGHSNIRTTQVYVHSSVEDLRGAPSLLSRSRATN